MDWVTWQRDHCTSFLPVFALEADLLTLSPAALASSFTAWLFGGDDKDSALTPKDDVTEAPMGRGRKERGEFYIYQDGDVELVVRTYNGPVESSFSFDELNSLADYFERVWCFDDTSS